MKNKELHFSQLIVNPNNDRHGPTPSEDTAIMWLFEHKTKEMKKLATKIASAGRIYDMPLVVPEGSSYLVIDGNRRVTCLKLIHEPSRAPEKLRNFFSDLNRESMGRLSEQIVCQVETDPVVADEIIGLRHNGTQEGAGQLMWGPREKAIHANRTAGKSDYEWPQLVERFLEDNGYTDEATAIKRSTLDRVLSAKKRRQRLGIGLDPNGELISTVAGYDVLPLLIRLAHDMRDNSLTLKETLVSKDVDRYLDKLQTLGLLPSNAPKGTPRPNPAPSPKPKPTKPKRNRRTTLIPSYVNYEFEWVSGQSKTEMAWSQLQFDLELSKHKFSVAVVFRTLLEMIAQTFIDKNQLKVQGTLSRNLKLVLLELEGRSVVSAKEVSDIIRVLEDKNSSASIENLQRILHSKSHMPSEDDLKTMWDCLEPMLTQAIVVVQRK